MDGIEALKAAGYPGISEPLRQQLLLRDRCVECAGGCLSCNSPALWCAQAHPERYPDVKTT